jgi:hypothetical protein
MALWRFLLVFALAFGSVLPHCAVSAPVSTAAHHVRMAHDQHQPSKHDQHQPSKAHVSDACIGCATPVRFALAAPVAPMMATSRYVVVQSTLTTRVTALDPPPPRRKA